MPDVAAVLVNHMSADRMEAAIASIRGEFREAGISGEVIVVDCASGAEEVRALESLAPDRLLPLPDNRGYSGGVNAGLAQARSPLILIANADVELSRGCLAPLLEAASRSEVGAAAPVQYADRGQRLLLPSGFPATFRDDLAQARARPGRPGDRRRFSRWARLQWKLWQEGGDAPHLAGSILAARKEVFNRVGRFDERFPFEYEETEWERRVQRAGLTLRVVAQARAWHFRGASSGRSPQAVLRARVSRDEYRRRFYGRLGAGLLERIERKRRGTAQIWTDTVIPARPGWAAAASPNASLLPFVGADLDSDLAVSELAAILGSTFFLVVFEIASGMPEAIRSVA